jgi:hypothetical protein
VIAMGSPALVSVVVLACGARTEVDSTADGTSSGGGEMVSGAGTFGATSESSGGDLGGGAGGSAAATTGGPLAPSYADCDERGPCANPGERCLIDEEQATGQYCTVPCAHAAPCAPAPDGPAEVDCRVLPSSPEAVCALDCSGTAAGLQGPCPTGMTCHQFPVGGTQHTCMWRD